MRDSIAALALSMCRFCDEIAVRCNDTYGPYFEKICYNPVPTRSEAFRVKQTKREWPDLFSLRKKKAQPQTKEPAPATPPPRLVVVRPGVSASNPFAAL